MAGPTAYELRQSFRAIPKEQRETHQSFAIRVWRAMSWLERAEQSGEVEDQFISLWIAFNALYGRIDDQNKPWGDREAMGTFLTVIWNLDGDGRIARILNRRQMGVLRLIETKYLCGRFWSEPNGDHQKEIRATVRELLPKFGSPHLIKAFRELFDRLYVMRNQVFHGASTKGSSLNRKMLTGSTVLLQALLPVMIEIMIGRGIDHDWGEVCFPPVK